MNLYEANKMIALTVKYVPEVGLLENIGIRVGTSLKIKHRYALGGPVLLRIEDAYTVAVGKEIALEIEVVEVNEELEGEEPHGDEAIVVCDVMEINKEEAAYIE